LEYYLKYVNVVMILIINISKIKFELEVSFSYFCWTHVSLMLYLFSEFFWKIHLWY